MHLLNLSGIILIGVLGFLAATDASAWTISENFDSQSAGETCKGWGSTQSTVSNSMSASGPNSCKQVVSKGETAFGEWGGVIQLPKHLVVGDEIWMRFRTFWPNGFDYNASPALKFMRIHTMDDANNNYGYNDWYIKPSSSSDAFYYRYEGEPQAQNHSFGSSGDKIKFGTWETYEMNIKLDTVSADRGGKARSKMWKNGKLIGEITVTPTMQQSQGYVDRVHILTYWNGSSPKTQEMYIDDLVITSDVPGNTDAAGNHFLGVGSFTATAAPKPPSSIK